MYGTLSDIELGEGVTDVAIYKETGATIPTNIPDGVIVMNVAEKAFRDAIEAASAGSTVTLHNDVELASAIVINHLTEEFYGLDSLVMVLKLQLVL